MKKGKILFSITLILFVTPLLVYAQTTPQVTLGSINLGEFPLITSYMDVRDSQGVFLSGLFPEDVVIFEDGEQLQAAEVIETRAGAQIVVALNQGTAFNVIDEEGIRRIDYVSQAITAWIENDEETPDRYSLISTEGMIADHTEEGVVFAANLNAYQSELAVLPTWDLLFSALDKVSDPLPREGMGRAVLFITPALPIGNEEIVQSLADRARQSGVRIYIGMIDSPTYFAQEEGLQLQQLAAQTGGQFFAFSGIEPLPDINAMLESSRRIYQLSYTSRVLESGVHDLEVIVHTPSGDIRSGFEEFSLEILPPNPIFLSPPALITRTIAEEAESEPENLIPTEETIQILIEFPDNIDREIVRSVLYVNGEFASENIAPLFTEFSLDISGFGNSQLIKLQVEAFDELGLSSRSIETPLQIDVIYPDNSFLKVLSDNIRILSIGISLFAGSTLLLLLLLAGKVRPLRFGDRLNRHKKTNDPLTQAVVGSEPEIKKRPLSRLFWEKDEEISPSPLLANWAKRGKEIAFLEKLQDGDELEGDRNYSIDSKEMTIGSGDYENHINIKNSAIEERHARIRQDEGGDFWLEDLNTIAGTWVNYQRIPEDGMQIFPGDNIHIANSGFRFGMKEPKNLRKVQITKVGEEE